MESLAYLLKATKITPALTRVPISCVWHTLRMSFPSQEVGKAVVPSLPRGLGRFVNNYQKRRRRFAKGFIYAMRALSTPCFAAKSDRLQRGRDEARHFVPGCLVL